MKNFPYLLLFIFFNLSFAHILNAQRYNKNNKTESLNIRTDPEWIKTNELFGFSMPGEVMVDKEGNIYSMAYIRGSMEMDGDVVAPKCNDNRSKCGEVSFLMKRAPNGEILWTRYAKGSARMKKAYIHDNFNITVIGETWGSSLELTSDDDKEVKHTGLRHGIFLCEYDSNGKLLRSKFHSDHSREGAEDVVVDNQGNLYIGGHMNVNNYDRSKFMVNYFLLKFNKDWELEWEVKNAADTIGSSALHSLFLSNGELYATGFYSQHLDINGKIWTSERSDQIPFVAQFNKKGKLKWLNDKISKHGTGVGMEVVADHKGDAYVAINTSYSYGIFTKVKKNGQLDWQFKMERSCTFYDLEIDEKDQLYLCGIGYGATFPTNASEMFSYTAVGGTDVFYASYTPSGELKWLKAAGGKGTDYCTSIALHYDKIYALGMTGGTFPFYKKTIENRRTSFWLAKFDLLKLATIDKTPPEPEKPKPSPLNAITCECQMPTHQPKFAPRIQDLAEYKDFLAMAKGWKPARTQNFYESMFYRDFQFQVGNQSSFYSLTGLCFKPMILMHPDETFALNFSACTSENKHTEIPMTVSYETPARRYIILDYKEFDKTARSYLEAFISILQISEKELLHSALFEQRLMEVNEFIRRINYKYGFNQSYNPTNEEDFITLVLDVLDRREIDFYEMLAQEFVVTYSGSHPVDATEKGNIEHLLDLSRRNTTFQKMHDYLYPSIRVNLNVKYLNIEIDHQMLRQWDNLQNAPKQEHGQSISPQILATVPAVYFSTEGGLTTNIQSICHQRSEVTNAGIFLTIKKATLLTQPTSYNQYRRVSPYQPYSPNVVEAQQYIGENDTLFSTFTGLDVIDALIHFDFKSEVVPVRHQRFLINNKMIYGEFRIPFTPVTDHEFTIKTEKGNIQTTFQELEILFGAKPFDYLRLEKKDNFIEVRFRKTW